MGHQRSRHGELDGGSRIGTRYRHTTPEIAGRVVEAIEARLAVVLQVAETAIRANPNRTVARGVSQAGAVAARMQKSPTTRAMRIAKWART